jgi:hypothetical protein
MSKRETPHLAVWGEYFPADDENNQAVHRARLFLIDAVRKVFPRFFEKLSDDVFPWYEKLAQSGYKFNLILWTNHPYDLLTDDGELKQALSEWAAELNACAKWLLDGALRTLWHWHTDPEWRKRFKWESLRIFGGAVGPMGKEFEFRYQAWDVQLLRWPVYRTSLVANFEKAVAEYERKTRENAEQHGLIRVPHKFSLDNLEWFALYQFAGMSSKKIADRSRGTVDESTVLKGVKAAAKLVGWDSLRQPKRAENRKIR